MARPITVIVSFCACREFERDLSEKRSDADKEIEWISFHGIFKLFKGWVKKKIFVFASIVFLFKCVTTRPIKVAYVFDLLKNKERITDCLPSP